MDRLNELPVVVEAVLRELQRSEGMSIFGIEPDALEVLSTTDPVTLASSRIFWRRRYAAAGRKA